MAEIELKRISEYIWEIPKTGGMRVPARVFASEKLLEKIKEDETLIQARNMTHLPGVHSPVCVLPDAHQGYGFPVGGVAALDAEKGVISPGAIGYDINCIAGNSLVLCKNGYTCPIAEMEPDWVQAELLCQDLSQSKTASTRPVYFLKRKPKATVYRVITRAGNELIATADHPFWTPRGMTELALLKRGDRLAIYPFQGVPYEKPSDAVIVGEEEIRQLCRRLKGGASSTSEIPILNHLKSRGLLPLRFNSPHLPLLLKVLGYLFGDGSLSFSGRKRSQGQATLYGKPHDLDEIRRDIQALGFSLHQQIYTRQRRHNITTTYRQYEFAYTEASFLANSTSLAMLLAALGAPVGNKAQQDYRLPLWLFQAPLWQKRLFLAALFGAELSTPQTLTDHGYNFYAPTLSLNKREGYIESGQAFLEDISKLLSEFGVETHTISKRPEQLNQDGTRSYRLRLILSSRAESLINLWSKVGFEYNRKRRALANAAVQYLKLKGRHLKERKEAAELVEELVTVGVHPQAIRTALLDSPVNERFIERSLYDRRVTSPRVAQDFPTFEEYLQEFAVGQSGMVWDEIESIEPISDFDDYVYDFTVDHPDHNFIANNFVVSNCGVRVCKTNLKYDDLKGKEQLLVDTLFSQIPTGIGEGSIVGKLSKDELDKVAVHGVQWALRHGYAVEDDLEHCEDNGVRPGADPEAVSNEAKERAQRQLGSLGSGNHFLEVQRVVEIFDERVAQEFGLFKDQIVIMIHCGSRGYGHQICTDYLRLIEREYRDLLNSLPDRQLACAPVHSKLAQDYYAAMNCAINFAWCNRQIIMHKARECFEQVFRASWRELGMHLLYDVAHNIGKRETHRIDGKEIDVYVHRKGATRAFPPGRREVPQAFRDVGQPIIIPGSMGTGGYILVGTEIAMRETFGSTAHGAGRVMSRAKATKQYRADNLVSELRERGIYVRGQSRATIAEEAPGAYKDLDEVVKVSHEVGIGRKVAKLVPVCNIKG